MTPPRLLFLRADGVTVDAADTVPDGATLIDPKGDRPYWRRTLTTAAQAFVRMFRSMHDLPPGADHYVYRIEFRRVVS